MMTSNQALLDAQLELWHTALSYIKSLALKAALELHIPDAIQHHGGSATLPEIVSRVPTTVVHPSKVPSLRRLMRVLTATGVLSLVGVDEDHEQSSRSGGGGVEPVYALTPMSRLLVSSSSSSWHDQSLAPYASMALHPTIVSTFFELGSWFQHELLPAAAGPSCVFRQRHGQTAWELACQDAGFNAMFNDAMASDTQFLMDIAVEECREVFMGISSLVDVAGGLGSAAKAVARAFPDVKCSVLDLAHVVDKAPRDSDDVKYVAGDMFQGIPPANAVLLKWILHDWDDEKCVVILKNCLKAIPPRNQGGKLIIIDMVVGAGPPDVKHKEVQALFDVCLLTLLNGIERDEQEWKKIFVEAGFSDYKINPVLGTRSIIEVYP